MGLKTWIRNLVEVGGSRVLARLFWPPPSVAVLVETEEGVLTVNFDGIHALPGGLVEPGEDLKSAAEREAKEETGYDVNVKELLDITTGPRKAPGIHFFFEAELDGGEPHGSWEGTPEFVPVEEMKDRVWRLHHSHVHEYLFGEGNHN